MKLFIFFTLSTVLTGSSILAQENQYNDSLLSFRNKYVNEHEVIKGDDRRTLRFYPIDRSYCIIARFEKAKEEPWFKIATSGAEKKTYRVYGTLYFSIHDTALTLQVHQSQGLLVVPEYADYLLIAFTDKTSGSATYENGRYIDARTGEMEQGTYILDFNKAYNPYCAYVSNIYNCPVPPKENDLKVAIPAGEMKFEKGH